MTGQAGVSPPAAVELEPLPDDLARVESSLRDSVRTSDPFLAEVGARVCICPTTEGNLGDGFAPVGRLRERGIGICIGSDSNVRIDPLEELRELETIARRQALAREAFAAETLLCFGADEGAAALGLESWPDVALDLDHPSLRGVEPADVFDALVLGCSADVFA